MGMCSSTYTLLRGEWFFGIERVQEPLTQGTVEDARGAAYAVWGFVWD